MTRSFRSGTLKPISSQRRGISPAVDSGRFDLHQGETLGLIGGSDWGKGETF